MGETSVILIVLNKFGDKIMKRTTIQYLLFILIYSLGATILCAQEATTFNNTTSVNLQEVSVELFEDPTLWRSHISVDDGISTHQRFEGSPRGKTALALQQTVSGTVEDVNILGIKTQFIRRGFTEIVFSPIRPIAIPGNVQQLSIWVAGRELEHDLYFLINDVDGSLRKIFVDTLNYRGWKQLTVNIPAEQMLDNGLRVGIKQYDPRRPLNTGIELVAIIIEPLYTEAYGTYYVYFDDLRAMTDLSIISERDPDDPSDSW